MVPSAWPQEQDGGTLANDEELMNFRMARSVLQLIDLPALPTETKQHVEKLKEEMNAVPCDTGKLERKTSVRYTDRVRHVLDQIDAGNLQLESKNSVVALKQLLSVAGGGFDRKNSADEIFKMLNSGSLGDKKRSMEVIRAGLIAEAKNPALPHLSSMEILKGVLSFTENQLDRKMSLEVFKNIISRPQKKPMATYDSFRFQKLANCLSEVEKQVTTDIDNDEYAEEVVAVDNIDHLLDDRPLQRSAATPASNIYMSQPTYGAAPTIMQHQQFTATPQIPFNAYSYSDLMYQPMMQQFEVSSPVPPAPQQQPMPPQDQSAKFCCITGCNNISRTKGICKTHGGGRRCKIDGCNKSAQTGHLCIAHGGGKPCKADGCTKTAQSRGLCKQHGGGARCKFEGCTKSCQSGGFCRGHGGGKRCEAMNCKKWAQRNGLCAKHAQTQSTQLTI